MGNPYTSKSISGYNTSPPPDDGTESEANRVNWSKHKTKLADPVKALAEAINTEVVAAFAKIALNNTNSQAGSYTVQAVDQGKLIRLTAAGTITTPSAATVGNPFMFAVKNEHTATITIDGNGAETIDGAADLSLPADNTVLLMTDGSNWFTGNSIGVTIDDVQNQSYTYFVDTGAVDAYVITPSPAIAAYADGQRFTFEPANTNTGASTIAINGLSAIAIEKGAALALEAGDLQAGVPAEFVIADVVGTTYAQLVSPPVLDNADRGSSMTLLASVTASASASADFTTNITSTYKHYRIIGTGLVPATDGAFLWCRTDANAGASFDTGVSDYEWCLSGLRGGTTVPTVFDEGDGADAQIVLTGNVAAGTGVGSAAGESISFIFDLYDPADTATITLCSWTATWRNSEVTGRISRCAGSGTRNSAALVDAVQFLFSTGNITSGELRMYGIKEA